MSDPQYETYERERGKIAEARERQLAAAIGRGAKLQAEVDRLQAAKREALKVADEKGKQNVGLRVALREAREKLVIYRAERKGEYTGGMEYSELMKLIDRALGVEQ